MKRARLVWAAVACTIVQSGCSRGTTGMVQVAGTVTLDGEPLPDASVLFVPDRGRVAFGVSDREGRFHLTTDAVDDGAEPGPYKIAVSAGVQSPIAVDEKGLESTQAAAAPVIVKSSIPLRYADPNGSGLHAVIDSKSRELTLPLNSRK